MPTLHTYRLFISHSWRYSEPYERMLTFLTAAPNFSYSNYSVPVAQAFDQMSVTSLKDELRGQIRPVHVAIILGGMWTSYSDWIQFEIEFAQSINKPILGVMPWGSSRTPAAVTAAASEIVGWNTSSIVSAIRRLTP